MLEIKTLGGLILSEAGGNKIELHLTKAQALLVFLAAENRDIPRAEVTALLWPESAEKQAMTSLRVILSSLRKYVGDYLEISRTHIKFNPAKSVYFDGWDLEGKINQGDICSALSLYQGDFLTGFEIQDSASFDEWCLMTQEYYRGLLTAALHKAISKAVEDRDLEFGLQLSSKLLEINPIDEVGHRYKIKFLAMAGRRSSSIAHYRKMESLLEGELGLEPSLESKQIFQQLIEDKIPVVQDQNKPKYKLPSPQTSFVDRVQEQEHIIRQIGNPNCRLLTLVGPGGIGKTRLAIEAANRTVDQFSEGACFIELSPLFSSEHIIPAIADSLQFKIDVEASNLSPKDQLLDFLENRSLLLILDSFEHLIKDATLVSEIINRAPEVKVLVTSREHLKLKPEWIFELKGLKIENAPDPQIEQVNGAVKLFIDRARQVDHNYRVKNGDLKHVVEICQLLHGMPLGIELAAGWSDVLSCSEIHQQINHSLDFLSTRLQDITPKHISIRAVFNRSWELLSMQQRDCFYKLSVFSGGFSLDAAAQVAETELDLIRDLVEKSLLSRQPNGRFTMHNTLQFFASEKLNSLQDSEDLLDRHAHFYVNLLLSQIDDLNGPQLVSARSILMREIGNLRLAIDCAALYWDVDPALKVLDGWFTFFIVQGWHEGMDAFKRLAELTTERRLKNGETWTDNPITSTVHVYYSYLATLLGFHEDGERISSEFLENCQFPGMESQRSICIHNLGLIAERIGDYKKSLRLMKQAIRLGKEHPNTVFPTYYLWLGYVQFLLGDYQQGMTTLQHSYHLFSEKNTLWGKGFALSKMSLAANGLGQYKLAIQYSQEALSLFQDIDDPFGISYAYSRLSVSEYFLEKYEQAVEYGEISNQLFRKLNHRWGISASLCRMGFGFLGLGELENAGFCFHEALEVSWGAQETPLCLYALAGKASWMMLTGSQEPAIALFQYIRHHPQTPSLYIQKAEIWFQEVDTSAAKIEAMELKKDGKRATLEEVVQAFLQGKGH